MNNVITVNNLSKVYNIYNKPIDRLKEVINPFKNKYHKEFIALHDVNFSVNRGDVVGIVGANGAGKSTLLKIITGVIKPTQGRVNFEGKISSLLELGTGFNPELSGIENIYYYGAISGYTKNEMDKRLSDILKFADIGEFIYQPLKTYSSGMVARVAFSCAINIDPEILIIDEALAVGDGRFQRKCMQKIQEFCNSGTVIIVSHSAEVIKKYCTKVIWLDKGQIIDKGQPKDIMQKYLKFMYDGENLENKSYIKSTNISKNDFGNGKALISNVILKCENIETNIFKSGEKVEIIVFIQIHSSLEQPILGFEFKDKLSQNIFGDNTAWMGCNLSTFKEGDKMKVTFLIPRWPNLKGGEYGLTLGLASGTMAAHEQSHYIHEYTTITSLPEKDTGCYFSDLDIILKLDDNDDS